MHICFHKYLFKCQKISIFPSWSPKFAHSSLLSFEQVWRIFTSTGAITGCPSWIWVSCSCTTSAHTPAYVHLQLVRWRLRNRFCWRFLPVKMAIIGRDQVRFSVLLQILSTGVKFWSQRRGCRPQKDGSRLMISDPGDICVCIDFPVHQELLVTYNRHLYPYHLDFGNRGVKEPAAV